MEDPGEDGREDWDTEPYDLVRPYFTGSGYEVDRPPDNPAADAIPGGSVSLSQAAGASMFGRSGPSVPSKYETALLEPVPAGAPAGPGRPGGTTGRHRALIAASRKWPPVLAFYRLHIAIGAAMVITALAGGVVLILLPGHSTATLASKCRLGSCHRIVLRPPGTVVPATDSASAGGSRMTPTSTVAITAEATAGQAAVTTAPASPTSVVINTPPVIRTLTPSPTPTQASPSPAPTPTTPGLSPGSRISIRATTACCTSFYIQHAADDRVVITQITRDDSATAKADATWLVRAGLANSSCISFESANDPGEYLRHSYFELYLNQDDGTWQFAQDATFCPQPGNRGWGYSFQSVNYPYKYIRHFDYVVYIASNGGSNPWDNSRLWPDDTTWLVSQPWG